MGMTYLNLGLSFTENYFFVNSSNIEIIFSNLVSPSPSRVFLIFSFRVLILIPYLNKIKKDNVI